MRPQQEAAHDARSRSGPRSPGPNTCAGQTIDDVEPARGDPQRLGLRRVLGVRVGHAELAAAGTRGARRPRRPAGAGPTAPTEDVCTTRSTPARSASSSTIARPLDVDARAARPAPRAGSSCRRRGRRGRRRAARAAARARSPSCGRRPLDVEALQRARATSSRAPSTRTSSPRSTSARATCEPTNPVAPVTSVGPCADQRAVRLAEPLGAPIGVRACPGRRRHRHDALPAARGRRAARDPRGLALRHTGTAATDSARRTCPTSTRSTTHLRSARRAAEHVAAVGRRLPRRLRAADRATAPTSSRSTSRAGSPAPCAAAEQARDQLVERGVAPERIDVHRLRDRLRGPRADGDRRRQRAPRAARDAAAAARPRAQLRARAEDPVRRRHARVPAPRRPDRRRAGVDRLDAEDQADPRDRVARSCRSSACARRAARSSGWSTTCRRAARTAATSSSSSTSRRPTRRSGSPSAAARSTARPEFVSEIGPVIGAHVGPGLIGVSGIPRRLLYPGG